MEKAVYSLRARCPQRVHNLSYFLCVCGRLMTEARCNQENYNRLSVFMVCLNTGGQTWTGYNVCVWLCECVCVCACVRQLAMQYWKYTLGFNPNNHQLPHQPPIIPPNLNPPISVRPNFCWETHKHTYTDTHTHTGSVPVTLSSSVSVYQISDHSFVSASTHNNDGSWTSALSVALHEGVHGFSHR